MDGGPRCPAALEDKDERDGADKNLGWEAEMRGMQITLHATLMRRPKVKEE